MFFVRAGGGLYNSKAHGEAAWADSFRRARVQVQGRFTPRVNTMAEEKGKPAFDKPKVSSVITVIFVIRNIIASLIIRGWMLF